MEIHASFHYILDDPEKEFAAIDQALKLIMAQPKYNDEYPAEFAAMSEAKLKLLQQLPDNEFNARLEEFRMIPDSLKKSHPYVKANVFANSYYIEMDRLVKQNRLEEALDLVPTMESIFMTFEELLPPAMKSKYFYLFAYVHLRRSDLTRALGYINRVINEFDDHSRPDLHAFSRILNLFIHFELGNFKLLRYITDATQRYLKKNDYYFKIEGILMKMFRRLANKPGVNEQRQILQNIENELELALKDPFEQKVLRYFDVSGWLSDYLGKIDHKDSISSNILR